MNPKKILKGIAIATLLIIAHLSAFAASIVSVSWVKSYKQKRRINAAIRKARKMDYCCTYRCCGTIGYCRGRVLQQLNEEDKTAFDKYEIEQLEKLIK